MNSIISEKSQICAECKYHISNRRNTIYAVVVLFLLFCIVCRILNYFNIIDKNVDIEAALLIGLISILVVMLILAYTHTTCERALLITGYFARLAVVFIDVYLRDYTSLVFSGLDSGGFWKQALSNYLNGEHEYYTNYPYVLEKFIYVVGANRMLVHYTNVLFWLLTVVIVYKTFTLLNIPRQKYLFAIGYICLAPMYLLHSAYLYRLGIIACFNTISFYFFLKWIYKGKFKNIFFSFLFVLGAMYLHSGSVGILVAYLFAIALYDPQKQKVRLRVKTILVGIFLFFGLLMLYNSPWKSMFLLYIPKCENIFMIQNVIYDVIEGSSYVLDFPYTENLVVLVFYTLIRELFFWTAPLPMYWRGFGDILAFAVDGLAHVAIFVLGIRTWFKSYKKERFAILLCLFSLFMIGVVFAWGVMNAGTAIRHRTKFTGIEVILLGLILKNMRTRRDLYGRTD